MKPMRRAEKLALLCRLTGHIRMYHRCQRCGQLRIEPLAGKSTKRLLARVMRGAA